MICIKINKDNNIKIGNKINKEMHNKINKEMHNKINNKIYNKTNKIVNPHLYYSLFMYKTLKIINNRRILRIPKNYYFKDNYNNSKINNRFIYNWKIELNKE